MKGCATVLLYTELSENKNLSTEGDHGLCSTVSAALSNNAYRRLKKRQELYNKPAVQRAFWQRAY